MFTETPLLSPLPTRPIRIVSMPSCSAALSFVCFLRPATLAFAHFFVLAILGDQLRKKWYLRLESIAKHKGFVDSRVNFTTKFMVVNLSKPYLAPLSENPVEGVCGEGFFAMQDIFLIAVFSDKVFFPWSRHFKKLQFKKNFFDCPQIWTVTRLAYRKQNLCANCLIRNITSSRVSFVRSLHIFLILFRKCSVTFYCTRMWQNADTF